MLGTREQAGDLARRVQHQLRFKLSLPSRFERARFMPIETQRHLERAVRYLLRQEEHHGIDLDPRHDGSSAPDIVGLRVLGTEIPQRMATALPRMRREEILDSMRLESVPPDFERLADLAAAACALPDLSGNQPRVVAARTAAIQAAPELSPGEVAALLGITRRCVERARKRPRNAALVRAICLQLTLRPREHGDELDDVLARGVHTPRDATGLGGSVFDPSTPVASSRAFGRISAWRDP
ncbi:MAG: hypothetical protein HOV80_00645 [Polyangiaceae bacterium]|nr:hypothetical protein [Polyangiaceae bacterium]